jgi:hypothetical protein
MWRAQSDPQFVLSGPFKDLVITVLDRIFEEFFSRSLAEPTFLDDVWAEVEEDPEDLFFIKWSEPFENYSTRDKTVLLSRVLRALLDPTEPAPPFSHCYESTMFAIIESIEVSVEEEIENAVDVVDAGGDPYEIRRLVSLTEKEYVDYGEYGQHIDYTSHDMDQWTNVVEVLAKIVLRNLDFLESGAAEIVADTDPQKVASLKAILGLNEGYYVDHVGLVSHAEFLTAIDYLLQTFNNK